MIKNDISSVLNCATAGRLWLESGDEDVKRISKNSPFGTSIPESMKRAQEAIKALEDACNAELEGKI